MFKCKNIASYKTLNKPQHILIVFYSEKAREKRPISYIEAYAIGKRVNKKVVTVI
jgi:hypothetical protein